MEIKTILSIETSGKVCSVALATFNSLSDALNYELIAEYNINIGNKHDKFCAELCNRIINDNGYNISNINAIAVSIGPGSFTGLRIGVAIAKGLCFDLIDSNNKQIPLIAVPTLTALSNNAMSIANMIGNENINILAIIPSHSNLVYYQLFDKWSNQISDIELIDLNLLLQKYYDGTDNIIITTNSSLDIDFKNYIFPLSYITAASIGRIGAIMYKKHKFTNSIDIQPLYIQDFIPK